MSDSKVRSSNDEYFEQEIASLRADMDSIISGDTRVGEARVAVNVDHSETATKLDTARALIFTGGVEGFTTFDGSRNLEVELEVLSSSHRHTVENIDGLQEIIDQATAGNHTHDASVIVTGILPVEHGGTGVDDLSKLTVGNAITIDGHHVDEFITTNQMDEINNTINNILDGTTPIDSSNHAKTADRATLADNSLKLEGYTADHFATAESVTVVDGKINNIINGITVVKKADEANHAKDADTLQGHAANYFATVSSVNNIISGATIVAHAAKADTVDTAGKLTIARTIALSGAVTGTATAFDGSKNITIPVTSINLEMATGVLPVSKGGTGQTDLDRVTVGKAKKADDSDNLGGKPASYYAPKDLISGILDGTTVIQNANYSNTSGHADDASKLTTARTIGISGAVTGTATAFDGTKNITIPITALDVSKATTGILAVARGGTGQSTLNAAANSFINSLSTSTTNPVDGDYYVGQYSNGGTSNTTFVRRPMSNLYAYVTSKLTKATIGLSNVDNTADSVKNVLSATKLTTARTIALSGDVTGTATSFNGTANITIPTSIKDFKGPSSTANGVKGLVPAPPKGNLDRFLKCDGTWATIVVVTQSTNGLMSAADKTKLDGIATGANKYVHPTTSGNKHIPAGGSSGQILRWSSDGTAVWGADTASKLATARKINLTGHITGSAKFDGSGDISISTTDTTLPKVGTITLASTGWTSTNGLYKQSVTISGLTAKHQVDLYAAYTIEKELPAPIQPVNDNGTFYVLTSSKPLVNVTLQYTLTLTA